MPKATEYVMMFLAQLCQTRRPNVGPIAVTTIRLHADGTVSESTRVIQ